MMDKKIYTTKNYQMFKKLLDNRDLRSTGINNIIDSINTIGYITNPIIINEKHEIIDGQHRLEALKALDLPVDYIIHKGAGIEECRLMNRKQGNWTMMDYLKSYARGGNDNYRRLYDLILAHPRLKIGVITYAINNNLTPSTQIKSGSFVCTKAIASKADELLKYIDDYVDLANKVNGNGNYLLCAMMYAHENDTVNIERLTYAIPKNISKCPTISKFEDALEAVSVLYNINSKNKIFLKTDWLRELQNDPVKAKKRENTKKSSERIRNHGALDYTRH